jgi:hypothetical protein
LGIAKELSLVQFTDLIELLDQAAEQADEKADMQDDATEADVEELNSEELLALNQASFEELKSGATGTVSFKSFKEWDDVIAR